MDEHLAQARAPTLIGRLRARLGLRWLYGLVGIPLLTDMIKIGSLPRVPRESTRASGPAATSLPLLLPGSTAEQAAAVVARVRAHRVRADAAWEKRPLGLGAGFAQFDSCDVVDDPVRRAGRAMCLDKASRRA